MALFKQKRTLSDMPAPPKPDFDISKPDFDDDFPKYTPSLGNFNDMDNKKRIPMPSMPAMQKKMTMENAQEKKVSGPVFIKLDKYEDALGYINNIRDKVKEIEDLIDNLRRIKRDEDSALDEWKNSLNEIKEKLSIVDRTLFES